MKNKIGCIITLTLVQLLFAVSLQAQQLQLGELELIYTEDEIPIRYDGSLSTLRKDGEMYFFHSFGCRIEPGHDRRSRHSWHKYRDGKWDIPGLSGQPDEDIIPHIAGGEDLHADAAYCTALGKYLITVQAQGKHKLFLLSSSDGLDWSLDTTVDQTAKRVIQAYSTFVDFNGPSADCHTVDDDFYIYFPRKGPDNDDDHLFRRKVTID